MAALVAEYRGRYALIGASALIIAMLVTLLTAASQTILAAAEQGVDASNGGYRYVVGAAEDSPAQVLNTMASQGGALAVARVAGEATGATGRSGAAISLVSGPSSIGMITEGRQPQRSGEFALTAELARRLGVRPGANVSLDSDDVDLAAIGSHQQFVGIIQDPADASLTQAVIVADPETVTPQAMMWLSNTDPCSDAALSKACSSGALSLRSRASLVAEAQAELRARVLSPVRPILVLLVLAGAISFTVLLSVDRVVTAPAAKALQASGASRRRATLLTRIPSYALLIAGSVTGVACGLLLLSALRERIAAAIGQSWDHVERWPWELFAAIAAYLLAALVLEQILPRTQGIHGEANAYWQSKRPALARLALVGASVGAVVLVYLRLEEHHRVLEGHFLGVVAAAVAWPLLLWLLPWRNKYPVRMRVVRFATGALLPALMSSLILQGCVAIYSASAWAATRAGSHAADASITVEGLSDQDLRMLRAEYPEILKEAIILFNLSEDGGQPRAASIEDADCQEAGCFSYLGTIALVADSGPGADLAGTANSMLDSTDGTIALVTFEPATPNVSASERLTVRGHSPLLHQYPILPGVILSESDPQLAALGLHASDRRTLFLEDFQSFPQDMRDNFRSDIVRQVGYAFVTEADNAEARQVLTMAVVMPALVLVASLVLQGLAVVAYVSRLRPVMEVRSAVYGRRGGEMLYILPACTIPTVCSAAIVLLGRWGAQPAVWMGSTGLDLDFGIAWALPAAAAPIISIALIIYWKKMTRHSGANSYGVS